LELQPLLDGAQHVPQLKPLPRFPAVRRDLSLVMSDSVRFEALQKLVQSVNPPNLEDVEYVGVYRGKPLAKGTKSETISLVFRAADQTLTSEAVDASVKKVIDAAQQQGFELRQ
jgi:phenylalanyl-tRNA synthetase beta chain